MPTDSRFIRRAFAALAVVLGVRIACAGDAAPSAVRELALRLAADGDHAGAAIEFRRLSLAVEPPEQRSAYLWAAASELCAAGEGALATAALDEADRQTARPHWCIPALRADIAGRNRDPAEAAFHWRSALKSAPGLDERTWTARRLAGALVRDGDPLAAGEALRESGRNEDAAMSALVRYRTGRDRRPLVGGLLGLVPGLGYAYSGEYASAGRSLILNGLFIWAMTYSAREEQWGAFAVAGFFEATWYSGSIYGGVDAAHRFNERRREDCAAIVERDASWAPVYPTLPVMSLRLAF